MNMRSDLHRQVNRKVSDFIVGEAGKVGSQSAFTAAAFIGATSLAGIFLSASNADAWPNCGGVANCAEDSPWCCGCWDEELNEPFDGCTQGSYACSSEDIDSPGISCWKVA